MSVVQTRDRRLVFGILLSALVVGFLLTLGQVPLAVSQPVAIPVKAIKGPIPMDGANPIWEGVPGVVVPLSGQTITTPMKSLRARSGVWVTKMICCLPSPRAENPATFCGHWRRPKSASRS